MFISTNPSAVWSVAKKKKKKEKSEKNTTPKISILRMGLVIQLNCQFHTFRNGSAFAGDNFR